MKTLSRTCFFLLVAVAFSNCTTTQNVASAVKNWALGVYKATSYQKQLANQRATAAYSKMSTTERRSSKSQERAIWP
jgi:hypothetical protein